MFGLQFHFEAVETGNYVQQTIVSNIYLEKHPGYKKTWRSTFVATVGTSSPELDWI